MLLLDTTAGKRKQREPDLMFLNFRSDGEGGIKEKGLAGACAAMQRSLPTLSAPNLHLEMCNFELI